VPQQGGHPDAPVAVEEAEAALVEHYPRLVRLAYLTLPAGLGRHRRVITAHRLAQRALPRSARTARGGAYGLLRREVLREAMAYGEGGRLRAAARTALDALRPPAVLGLRVHPQVGGDAELALERALSALPAAARAAYALQRLEGLGERVARSVLESAGAADPVGALRAAAGVAAGGTGAGAGGVGAGGAGLGMGADPSAGGAGGGAELLRAPQFDPCTVQARPTDLLRRRQRSRVALVAAAVLGVGALLLAVDDGGHGGARYTAAGTPGADPRALDPAALVRVAPTLWRSTGRLDFSAWPARGDRASDTALLGRALAVWARPGSSVDFYDGLRVVRYAQPRHGGGRAALDLAQAANADLTSSAAVLLDRVDGNARYLTAPWVAAAQSRDLLAPDRPAASVHRSGDGVTDPVRMPAALTGAACGSSWPVLQLRSSAAVVEHHSFLVTDLGDILPTHLTYTAPPSAGVPAGAPREATGTRALASWAHDACGLAQLRGQSVKSVNDWEFARTPLPEGAGTASWTCDRADTWRGPGLATVRFVPPDAAASAAGSVVGQQADGSACGRFGRDVMAGVMWRAPSADWYLVAAGSRGVTRITASHGVDARADGPFLAVRAPRGARATLTGRLASGGSLAPLGQR
jgi:hypothetical protein